MEGSNIVENSQAVTLINGNRTKIGYWCIFCGSITARPEIGHSCPNPLSTPKRKEEPTVSYLRFYLGEDGLGYFERILVWRLINGRIF